VIRRSPILRRPAFRHEADIHWFDVLQRSRFCTRNVAPLVASHELAKASPQPHQLSSIELKMRAISNSCTWAPSKRTRSQIGSGKPRVLSSAPIFVWGENIPKVVIAPHATMVAMAKAHAAYNP
jgi:hypothetical protein